MYDDFYGLSSKERQQIAAENAFRLALKAHFPDLLPIPDIRQARIEKQPHISAVKHKERGKRRLELVAKGEFEAEATVYIEESDNIVLFVTVCITCLRPPGMFTPAFYPYTWHRDMVYCVTREL